MLQQIDDFQAGALLIEVIELGGVSGILKPLVNALALRVEDAHADLAERCSVVGKGAIAERGTRDGSEPAVEYGEVRGQRSEHRQLVLGEVVHDLLRVGQVLLLLVIVLNKALHAGHARVALVAVEDLLVDGRKGMVGIGIELALKLGQRLHEDLVALGVGVPLRPVHSVN